MLECVKGCKCYWRWILPETIIAWKKNICIQAEPCHRQSLVGQANAGMIRFAEICAIDSERLRRSENRSFTLRLLPSDSTNKAAARSFYRLLLWSRIVGIWRSRLSRRLRLPRVCRASLAEKI